MLWESVAGVEVGGSATGSAEGSSLEGAEGTTGAAAAAEAWGRGLEGAAAGRPLAGACGRAEVVAAVESGRGLEGAAKGGETVVTGGLTGADAAGVGTVKKVGRWRTGAEKLGMTGSAPNSEKKSSIGGCWTGALVVMVLKAAVIVG